MGLFGKKKDFWDEVDEVSMGDSEDSMYEASNGEDEANVADDGRWHPTKCAPLKAMARMIMLAAAVVMAVSGMIVYTYFNNGGTSTSDPEYYSSSYFGEAYNQNVEQLLKMLEAIEKRGDISEENIEQANQDMIADYMSLDGNFSFVIYDADKREVISSGDDAVERIESSYYFVRMDTAEGDFNLSKGMNNSALKVDSWEEAMTSLSGKYTVYSAVDNELNFTGDIFDENAKKFEKLTSQFELAKTAAIAAAVVFVLMLIFSIAATGRAKGYAGVKLSLFDKVFTEIAMFLVIAMGGASVFGAYYTYTSDMSFGKIAACGCLVLTYVILIRGFFSMVRRIKSGTFISNMLIYRIFEAIGKLPVVPRVFMILVVLVLLNGALIFALFNLDSYEIMGIPVVYVLVPVVFVLENICFISWVIRKGNAEYEEEETEDVQEVLDGDTKTAEEMEDALVEAAAIAASEELATASEWENMDLGASVDQAIEEGPEFKVEEEVEEAKTVILPQEEIESLLVAAEETHESATSFDFIQLNKDVRKLHRAVLKESGITVTLRAPEKPIVLEMNKEDMWKAISAIYDNLEQYADPDTRVYAEMYTQNGKLIYIVKNAVKADAVEAAKAVAAKEVELAGGLKIARQIVEKNHGKFVVAMDGNIFKTGILLDMVQAQQ